MITPTKHRPILTLPDSEALGRGKQYFGSICHLFPPSVCISFILSVSTSSNPLMEVKDRAEDSDGHASQNNGFIVCSQARQSAEEPKRILGDCSVLQGKALKFPIIFGCTTMDCK